jgi:hypothetical protein
VFAACWLAGRLAAAEAPDPFADLETRPPIPPPAAAKPVGLSWWEALTTENLSFKKELYGQLTWSANTDLEDSLYSRQSAGFELLKKFSTRTATIAAFDVQVRMVRRDHFLETLNDMEGLERGEWFLEYHNVYWDLYNVFNWALSDAARGEHTGRFNLRVGRFYLPLGLNLQTDTHGTLLQLTNDRNLGFERDWLAGFWGSLTPDLSYDLYWLAGSGYDLSFKGQCGLLGARLSLGNKYRVEHGLEAGVGFAGGERLAHSALMRSPAVAADSRGNNVVRGWRAGLDVRYSHTVPTGLLTFTTELTAGQDEPDWVWTQLHQFEYLHRSRRFGLAAQFRRFWQDFGTVPGVTLAL